jgi:MGT family glycosyltransferase
MKLGFICLNVPGHLNPMTTLARHLQYRNHEVVFLYSSGAAGLPFVPGPEKDHFNENRPAVSKMQILNGRLDVFRTIVTALAKHNDLQLVLSVGDQVAPEQIGPVPSNAIIVKRAPQLELLKQTSVCITHAGLNTVLESLAQGVPQVAIPVTYDQPGVAARIADKKTGVVTSLDKLTPDHLSSLLNEVLTNSVYRKNAKKLQEAIAEADGLSAAAGLVEESLGLTHKVAQERRRPT